MADSARREVNVFWSGIKEVVVSKSTALEECRKIGNDVVKITRSRTNAGIGRDGEKLPKYKSSYRKQKAGMISGRIRWPKGAKVSDQFKARRVNDKGRLTGQTFEEMTVVRPRVEMNQHSVDLFVTVTVRSPKIKKRIGFLLDRGYDILGLAKPSTAIGKAERRQILRNSRRRIQAGAKAKGVVLEDS